MMSQATNSNSQVSGKVTDAQGNPIAEAGVAVSKSSVGVPEILVLTNEIGNYKWNLPAGIFTLTVSKDGYVKNSQEIRLQEGQTVELNFELKNA